MFILRRFVVPILDRLGSCFSVAQGGPILASGLDEMAVFEVPLRETKKSQTRPNMRSRYVKKKGSSVHPRLASKALLGFRHNYPSTLCFLSCAVRMALNGLSNLYWASYYLLILNQKPIHLLRHSFKTSRNLEISTPTRSGFEQGNFIYCFPSFCEKPN